jgi:hypothetical protein
MCKSEFDLTDTVKSGNTSFLLWKLGFYYTDIVDCDGEFFLEIFTSLILEKGVHYNGKWATDNPKGEPNN